MKKIFSILLLFILILLSSCKKDAFLTRTKNINIEVSSQYASLILNDELDNVLLSDLISSNYLDKLTYSVSNDCIEISNNKVIAKKRGLSTLSIEYSNICKTIEFEVFNKETNKSITNENIFYYDGRVYIDEIEDMVIFNNPLNSVEFNFIGTRVFLSMEATGLYSGALKVVVDGNESIVPVNQESINVLLCNNLENKIHNIKVIKLVEDSQLRMNLYGFNIYGTFLNNNIKKDYNFEFYGDSITCGVELNLKKDLYFNDENASLTYINMLKEKYDARTNVIAESGISVSCKKNDSDRVLTDFYDNVSPGSEYKYDYSSFNTDIVFINLGTNDVASPMLSELNIENGYYDLLIKLRNKNPNAYIICIYGNISVNDIVRNGINNAINKFSNDVDERIKYLEIETELFNNESHPNYEGHKRIFETLVDYIENNNILN